MERASEGDSEVQGLKGRLNYKMGGQITFPIRSLPGWQMRPKIGLCFHLEFVAALYMHYVIACPYAHEYICPLQSSLFSLM